MNCTFGGAAQDSLQTDTTLGHGYDLGGETSSWESVKDGEGVGEKTKCREMFDRKLLSGMSIGVTETKITVEGDGGLLQGAGELVSRHLFAVIFKFFPDSILSAQKLLDRHRMERSSRRNI